MGIYWCRDCDHQGLGQHLWAVRSLCLSKYPTKYQFTPKYSWKFFSGLLWGEEPALSVLTEHSQGNPERFEPVGAQQCSQLQADEIFATSVRERIELGAVYPQDWFFKMTTIFHEGWRVSLPTQGWKQWRLFLPPKISGEADREVLVYSVCRLFLPLFMLIPCTLCLTQCNLAYKTHQQTLKSRHSLWAPGPLLHHPHIPKQPTAR